MLYLWDNRTTKRRKCLFVHQMNRVWRFLNKNVLLLLWMLKVRTDQSERSVWPPQFIYRNTLNTMQKKSPNTLSPSQLHTSMQHSPVTTVQNNIHHRASWQDVTERQHGGRWRRRSFRLNLHQHTVTGREHSDTETRLSFSFIIDLIMQNICSLVWNWSSTKMFLIHKIKPKLIKRQRRTRERGWHASSSVRLQEVF